MILVVHFDSSDDEILQRHGAVHVVVEQRVEIFLQHQLQISVHANISLLFFVELNRVKLSAEIDLSKEINY